MTDYRFWKHETSGEIYAVRFSDGESGIRGSDITGVCGPLHYEDRLIPTDEFEYDTEDIDWLIENSGYFRETYPIHSAAETITIERSEDLTAGRHPVTGNAPRSHTGSAQPS